MLLTRNHTAQDVYTRRKLGFAFDIKDQINHTAQDVYTRRKLGFAFDIKDQIKLEHKHDLTKLVKCPEDTCSETY